MERGSSKWGRRNPSAKEIMVSLWRKASYFLELTLWRKPSNQACHCPYCGLTLKNTAMGCPTIDSVFIVQGSQPMLMWKIQVSQVLHREPQGQYNLTLIVKSLTALTSFRCTHTSARRISTLVPLFSSIQLLSPFLTTHPMPLLLCLYMVELDADKQKCWWTPLEKKAKKMAKSSPCV